MLINLLSPSGPQTLCGLQPVLALSQPLVSALTQRRAQTLEYPLILQYFLDKMHNVFKLYWNIQTNEHIIWFKLHYKMNIKKILSSPKYLAQDMLFPKIVIFIRLLKFLFCTMFRSLITCGLWQILSIPLSLKQNIP